MRKTFELLFIVCFVFACGNKKNPSTSEAKDSIVVPTDSFEMEHMAVNMVFDIPEVKQKAEEIKLTSKNEIDIGASVLDYPHQNKKGYFRIVIEATNSDVYPLPLFTFDVFFPSLDICYWDTIQKKQIPIEEWRGLTK